MQLQCPQAGGLTARRRDAGRQAFSCPRPAVQPALAPRPTAQHTALVLLQASRLGDVPLFADSSLLSGGGPSVADNKASAQQKLDEVPLQSEAGLDYTTLRNHLKAGEWRLAEDETRALLIKLAGEGAVKRGWVYFTEVKDISVADFQTLDNLWKAASNGKFGYSVQKEIWVQNSKRWSKFFKLIDWTVGENSNYRKWPMEFNYSMDAPRGHLPLTNALRGTQLFQAIMEHPAFDAKQKRSIDEKAADAASGTLKFSSF